MSDTRHTPGPWHISNEPDDDDREEGVDTRLFVGEHGRIGWRHVCQVSSWGDPRADEVRANALLIAAAPDLLEAAEGAAAGIEDALETGGFVSEIQAAGAAVDLRYLRAAIAKARGERGEP